MSNKTEEQLKMLNEILAIATFSRRDDGSLYVNRVKGQVGVVEGQVGVVEGGVGWAKGDVYKVGGAVHTVEGDVYTVKGNVGVYKCIRETKWVE